MDFYSPQTAITEEFIIILETFSQDPPVPLALGNVVILVVIFHTPRKRAENSVVVFHVEECEVLRTSEREEKSATFS